MQHGEGKNEKFWALAIWAAISLASAAAHGDPLPAAAIFSDPAPDKAFPARSEVLHIPSGGVLINGLAYVPTGPGAHPTVVLLHGLPGNEKNLDLAQATRRAGWTVVTFNYRGSWGSPGVYSFKGNLQDAAAVLAYLRTPDVAAKLQIDPVHMVLMGHSMGGWVTAVTAARDPSLIGAALISAADMSSPGLRRPRCRLRVARDNMESLAGVTDQTLADQFLTLTADDGFATAASGLATRSLLVLERGRWSGVWHGRSGRQCPTPRRPRRHRRARRHRPHLGRRPHPAGERGAKLAAVAPRRAEVASRLVFRTCSNQNGRAPSPQGLDDRAARPRRRP